MERPFISNIGSIKLIIITIIFDNDSDDPISDQQSLPTLPPCFDITKKMDTMLEMIENSFKELII
ncbi:hypothetical protein DERP_013801 [Dermatophagoides pteronyssinus]|uniref:Uncharacterized protein n=1 Tax=Dermatophagoides pteronyssinus TaxID=6956 RepID=A0ABQ8JCL4_DERPT|nr:hypothetical protein DERP_013801 [Dermatophagoides pteronyssinus]